MLGVLAQALSARLPGYTTATPQHPATPIPRNPGQIITTAADTIIVRLNRRAYSPVLRQADLPDTPPPMVTFRCKLVA